ncbi:MAG: two-component system response regulator [Desulfobacterales bacterium]|nr:MAG: two-component system response regulator [Desulfobacterales bacterium]
MTTDETIMIVDDIPENLMILSSLLKHKGYHTVAFPDGEMALSAALRRKPDLVLLDINMPHMNGFEVCDTFKRDAELTDIPIIFISALDSTDDKVRALNHGGVDYITKPFQSEEVYARVNTHLQLNQAKRALKDFNQQLTKMVCEQVEEIHQAQIATIFALAKLSHTRDDDTGLHLERVQHLCRLFATRLSQYKTYENEVNENFILTIFHASPLHDLGKVGIADSILLKPARLTSEEFAVMKTHTTIGAQTLQSVYKSYPNSEFIRMGIDIAKHHHEKWDGSGYPSGLQGEEIPLSARIMAIVDVYDALRARRPYKEAFSHTKSKQLIIEEKGRSFDPDLIDIFLTIDQEFEKIINTLSDDIIVPKLL